MTVMLDHWSDGTKGSCSCIATWVPKQQLAASHNQSQLNHRIRTILPKELQCCVKVWITCLHACTYMYTYMIFAYMESMYVKQFYIHVVLWEYIYIYTCIALTGSALSTLCLYIYIHTHIHNMHHVTCTHRPSPFQTSAYVKQVVRILRVYWWRV